MYGKATLDLPHSGVIGSERYVGLSDALAVSIGRIAAMTLSDEHEFVTVSLESGETVMIGQDTLSGQLHIGRLR